VHSVEFMCIGCWCAVCNLYALDISAHYKNLCALDIGVWQKKLCTLDVDVHGKSCVH
jgi:hypothetical protein